MEFNLDEYLKTLPRKKKEDDIPGTVDSYLEDQCPTGCGGQLRQMRPCCGSPGGFKECGKCHYKIT